MSNLFAKSITQPGQGTIHLGLLPPSTPRLRTVTYQYPLKLVSPAPLRTIAPSLGTGDQSTVVHTVYLLTYGGGLVAGDCIDLTVTLEPMTRLVLLTQGSTKLFNAPDRTVRSVQSLAVNVHPGAMLCYLPDPVQPFRDSCYEQRQTFDVRLDDRTDSRVDAGNLCVLDWVSSGRSANGENWSFFHYASCSEIYLAKHDGSRRLLMRDNLALDDQRGEGSIADRMNGLAVFGTLVLYGPKLDKLGKFFMEEFRMLPRVGGRQWDSGSESGADEDVDATTVKRAQRHRREATTKVLWSAASVRGCAVVKFGAPALEAARTWLHNMLVEEGSVVELCGERALLCLR